MSDPLVALSHVEAGYGKNTVVSDFSLTISQGEILTLVGPNGCGKSTLLKTLAGHLPPLSGQLSLQGKPLSGYAPKELAKTLSFLPQGQPTPDIEVEQLVYHGRFPYLGFQRRLSAFDRQKAEEAMAFTGLLPLRHRLLSSLSGGEKQKAYLAMVIAQDTPLLLLDEPTTYLDIGHQFELLSLVQTLNAAGKTIVMVLHDLSHALTYSHRIALLQQGRLLCCQEPAALFASGALQQVFGVTGHQVCRQQGYDYYFTP